MDKLDGKTRDLVADNIEELKQLFPEVFTEDKIDFDKLKSILGEEVETENERYSFTWNGKSDAKKIALKQSTGSLRPDKELSKNWDETENLFIEGDNLEVLRLLQNSYRNKVKMIYIDPPYNTDKDFVYTDKFSDTVEDYKERVDEKFKTNSDTSGRYHTNWLNMMYPRLFLAKNLLKDDGVIFVSIDDNEVHNLRHVMNKIFGEENFVEQFNWVKTETPSNLSKKTKGTVEYLLCYEKVKDPQMKYFGQRKTATSKNSLLNQSNSSSKLIFPKDVVTTGLSNIDFEPGIYGTNNYKIELLKETKVIDGKFVTPINLKAKFRWTQKYLEEQIESGTKISISRETLGPSYEKSDYGEETPSNLVNSKVGVDTYEQASSCLEELLGGHFFDYPKPVSLIKYFISFFKKGPDKEITLDFFAGSGTTAQAVMAQNAEDGGNRKCISVQLPEVTDEDSEARKAGYETIADIAKERIRRAGEKILDDYEESLKERDEPLDVGFKAFTLDTTNLSAWDEHTDDVEKTLLDAVDIIKDGRSEEDVLYEIFLKYGVDLTTPIEETDIEGKTVYKIAGGYLTVCLEEDLDAEFIEKIAEEKPQRVVFRDTGFADDTVKVNAEMTLKKHGVEDIKVL